MPWRIRNDELSQRRLEIAVGDVDRDALFLFSAQPVRKQCKIDGASRAVETATAHRSELIFGISFGVVQQTAYQSRFAIIHAARGGQPQQVLIQVMIEQRSQTVVAIALSYPGH